MSKTKIVDLISGKKYRERDVWISKTDHTFLDMRKPFAVIRDDGKIIRQFKMHYDATEFSVKLNISYKDNNINAYSKVVQFSD